MPLGIQRAWRGIKRRFAPSSRFLSTAKIESPSAIARRSHVEGQRRPAVARRVTIDQVPSDESIRGPEDKRATSIGYGNGISSPIRSIKSEDDKGDFFGTMRHRHTSDCCCGASEGRSNSRGRSSGSTDEEELESIPGTPSPPPVRKKVTKVYNVPYNTPVTLRTAKAIRAALGPNTPAKSRTSQVLFGDLDLQPGTVRTKRGRRLQQATGTPVTIQSASRQIPALVFESSRRTHYKPRRVRGMRNLSQPMTPREASTTPPSSPPVPSAELPRRNQAANYTLFTPDAKRPMHLSTLKTPSPPSNIPPPAPSPPCSTSTSALVPPAPTRTPRLNQHYLKQRRDLLDMRRRWLQHLDEHTALVADTIAFIDGMLFPEALEDTPATRSSAGMRKVYFAPQMAGVAGRVWE